MFVPPQQPGESDEAYAARLQATMPDASARGWFTGPGTLAGSLFGLGMGPNDQERADRSNVISDVNARMAAARAAAPQGANESNIAFGARHAFANSPNDTLANIADVLPAPGSIWRYMADTPAAGTARADARSARATAANSTPTPYGSVAIPPAFAAPGGPAAAAPTDAGHAPFVAHLTPRTWGLPTPTPPGARVVQGIQPMFSSWNVIGVPGDPRRRSGPNGTYYVPHAGVDFRPPRGSPTLIADRPFEIVSSRPDHGITGISAIVRFQDDQGHPRDYNMMHLAVQPRAGSHGGPGDPIAIAGFTGNAENSPAPQIHVQPWGDNRMDARQFFGTPAAAAPGSPEAITQTLHEQAGNFGAPAPQFDSSGFDQAAGYARQALNAATTPYSFTAQEAPRPDRPAPTPFAAPDFTAGDKAFAQAAPTNRFDDPTTRTRFLRQQYLGGMARALSTMDWGHGPGVGELLARVGAGALSGRLQGEDELRHRQDIFDSQMREYQQAVSQRDDSHATAISNTANQNIAQMNNYNNERYADTLSEWTRNQPRIENGNLITRHRVGNTDNWQTVVTPVGPAARVAYYNQMASLSIGRGEAQNSYNMMTWQAAREDARFAMQYAMLPQSGASPQAQDQAALIDMSGRIGGVVHSGHWQSIVQDPNAVTELENGANAAAGYTPGPGQLPMSESQRQVHDDYLTTELINRTLQGGPEAIRWVYHNPMMSAAYLNHAAGERGHESVSTTNRGSQTRTVTSSFGGN